MLQLKTFVFNPLMVNCYVIWSDNGDCAIIDPSCYYEDEQNNLVHFIESNRLQVKHIIITHYHFDHMMGAHFVTNKFSVPLSIHKDYVYLAGNFDISSQMQFFGFDIKKPPKPKVLLEEGDEVHIGKEVLKVIHIPGHSPCCISLYAEKSFFIITGDILFKGGVGRTDLPLSDINKLLNGIKHKLFTLPDNTIVYPGHGEETSIGEEKKYNTFV